MRDLTKRRGPGHRGSFGNSWTAVALGAAFAVAPTIAAQDVGPNPAPELAPVVLREGALEIGVTVADWRQAADLRASGRVVEASGSPTAVLLVSVPPVRSAQRSAADVVRACVESGARHGAEVVVLLPSEGALDARLRRSPGHRRIDSDGRWRRALIASRHEHGATYVLIDDARRVLAHGRLDGGVRYELIDAASGRLDLRTALAYRDDRDRSRANRVGDGGSATVPRHYRPWVERLRALPVFSGLGGVALERELAAAREALAGRPEFFARVLATVAERFPEELRRAKLQQQLHEMVRERRRDATVQEAGFRCYAELGEDRRALGCGFAWLQSCKGVAGRAAEVLDAIQDSRDGEGRFPALTEQAIEVGLGAEPNSRRLRMRAFEHALQRDPSGFGAYRAGCQMAATLRGDAQALNAFAWRLLTDAPYAGHCQKVALEAARAMAEIPDWRSHWRVDTLALACFENGLVDEAVELQREAVDSADAAARARYELRLERYRSAQR